MPVDNIRCGGLNHRCHSIYRCSNSRNRSSKCQHGSCFIKTCNFSTDSSSNKTSGNNRFNYSGPGISCGILPQRIGCFVFIPETSPVIGCIQNRMYPYHPNVTT